MPTLIKDGQVIEDLWEKVSMESGLDYVTGTDSTQHVIVPLAMWAAEKDTLLASGKAIGVCLDSEDDPYELAGDVDKLALVGLYFPVFRDGRPFSSAAIIRNRLGFKGELRARGDVLRDQLFYMRQCGIDSFELPDTVDVDEALAAFNDFATNYQSTVATPTPLFRRR